MTGSLRAVRMVILTVGFLVASVAVGISPASAADPTITVRPGGALHARGAAVVIQATVSCPAGALITVSARATQRKADGSLVRGFAQRPVRCTGAAITRRIAVSSADIRFTGSNSGAPFVIGAVFATASFQMCDDVRCVTAVHSRTVQAANVLLNAAQFTSASLVASLPAQAALQASGAGVLIRVPYRCAAGLTATIDLVLIERTSTAAVTSSFDGVEAPCSGLNRTAVVTFHADVAAWRPGSAFAVLGGQVCGGQGCQPAYAHRTLALV
jgi:hypothetical protein